MNLELVRKALGAVAFSIVAVALPSVAQADGACDPSQGPCILEPVEISGSCGAACVSTGFGGGWGIGGGGSGLIDMGNTAALTHAAAKAAAIKTIFTLCKSANESQYNWLSRQVQNCVTDAIAHWNATMILACKEVGTDLIPSAATDSLNPPPVQC